MSRGNQIQKARKTDHDLGGLIPPSEIFDHPLSCRLVLDIDLPFEERVERAWERLKLTRFTPEEHERLREVLVKRIDGEQRGGKAGG